MDNLAGNQECDVKIERELTRCGIKVVKNQPRSGEVPSSLRGKLGNFTFFRAWYYWVVSGPVPLAVAKELYKDPVGKTDIRVNGNCGCPAPGEPGGNAVWIDRETKKKLVTNKEWAEMKFWADKHGSKTFPIDNYLSSDDPTTGEGFIESYHIDSELGLRIFADTLKKHNLVKVKRHKKGGF